MAEPYLRLCAKSGSLRVIATLSSTLMVGACAQIGADDGRGLLAGVSGSSPAAATAPAFANAEVNADDAAKRYSQNPRSLENALAYARSLKSLGQKRQALGILQQAAEQHSSSKELASEYGRLALDLDQVSLAKRLLEVADDPVNPDWRVVMARGTASAKEGHYKDATAFYEKALSLQPEQASIMSNLALAYTLSGDAEKGETLLRRAAASPDANAKVRQNLALVLGIQGKYEEATKIGSVDLPPESAQKNTEVLREIVKAEPKAITKTASLPAGVWETQVNDEPAQPVVTTVAAKPAARGMPTLKPSAR